MSKGSTTAPLTINDAQKWFESTVLKIQKNRTTSDTNPKTALWEKAYYYDFPFGKAVVVPLKYEKNDYPKFNKNGTKKELPKHHVGLNELNNLIVYKDDKGITHQKVIRLIPDEDFLDKSNERKKKTPYDGYVIVDDWNGSFIEGYLYDNGNVKGTIIDTKNANGRVKNLVCETTDWYSCASGDGGNTWYCSYNYTTTTCVQIGGDSGGGIYYGDFSSLSGGSYGDGSGSTSNPPPPKTTFKVYEGLMNQSTNVGGNYGLVNTTTPLSSAWNTLKSTIGSTLNSNGTITDSIGNVNIKYNQSSTIPGYNLVGTISISSGPNATQKIRFTNP